MSVGDSKVEMHLLSCKRHLHQFDKDGNASHLVEALKESSAASAINCEDKSLCKLAAETTEFVGSEILKLIKPATRLSGNASKKSGNVSKKSGNVSANPKTKEKPISFGKFDSLKR